MNSAVALTKKTLTADEQYQAALKAVTSSAFHAASAREKQDILWSFISQFPYHPLPSARVTDFQTLSRLTNRAFLRRSFAQDDDVRPPRIKAFHTWGTTAKMRFVADGNHPFTGIFATGSVGFMRASLAVGIPNYSPAAAFKFLLAGPHPSQNLLLHQSLDVQASRDFFERAPTNRTLEPITFPNTLVVAILRLWLSAVSRPIEMHRLDHLAEVTNDGTVVAEPFSPELVHLYGGEDVHSHPASTEDFRTILSEIPPSSLLYRMYGRETEDAKQVYIGSIISESAFVASEFGDCILAFQHAWGSKSAPADR